MASHLCLEHFGAQRSSSSTRWPTYILWLQKEPKSSALHLRTWQQVWRVCAGMPNVALCVTDKHLSVGLIFPKDIAAELCGLFRVRSSPSRHACLFSLCLTVMSRTSTFSMLTEACRVWPWGQFAGTSTPGKCGPLCSTLFFFTGLFKCNPTTFLVIVILHATSDWFLSNRRVWIWSSAY